MLNQPFTTKTFIKVCLLKPKSLKSPLKSIHKIFSPLKSEDAIKNSIT